MQTKSWYFYSDVEKWVVSIQCLMFDIDVVDLNDFDTFKLDLLLLNTFQKLQNLIFCVDYTKEGEGDAAKNLN